MKILSRVNSRFKTFYTTLAGTRFQGTISPVSDVQLPTVAFYNPRHLLRTRPDEPVRAGDVFRDQVGRVFLVAEHDKKPHAKTFVIVEMTHYTTWKRVGDTIIHPVTKQKQPGPTIDMPLIWCAIESEAAIKDGGLNISIPRQRLITGALVKEGDLVNDQMVKELTTTLGVQVGDLE